MKTAKIKRVGLLFNANKSFDREVMVGIAACLQNTRDPWDLFLEEDFRLRLDGIERWQGGGIIADFDDPAVAAALSHCSIPVVGVGGSYADESDYPRDIPYVATDNFALIERAREHLIDAGLLRFAMFSLPEARENRWALERENAFRILMEGDKMEAAIFRGSETSATSWDAALQGQIAWLRSLPKPIGIIAVTDARARQLLQACAMAGIEVPEQVALIGIDNDPMVRMLTRIPLSSVIQGAQEIGRVAAHLLVQILHGVPLANTRILVPPAGINVFASSVRQTGKHRYVMRAQHFIRQYACQGIKSQQVADYVGVSYTLLQTYFRQELGCTVHEEILRIRLDAAMASLACRERSIADVAMACGFTTTQYMHMVFQRELGCTPRTYRDRALGAAR